MFDFKNNVLPCNIDSWKLDNGLKEILIEINQNNNIQTLYSKWWDSSPNAWQEESYLTICYSKKVELFILREIAPYLFARHNDIKKAFIDYNFSKPRDNPNYNENEPTNFKMYCITDPNYFRINTIKIKLTSPFRDCHNLFWSDIKEYLATIG